MTESEPIVVSDSDVSASSAKNVYVCLCATRYGAQTDEDDRVIVQVEGSPLKVISSKKYR